MSNGGGFYSVSAYLEETRRLGLEILLPDINHSQDVFIGQDRKVRIGLQRIHGMSRCSLDALLDERDSHGYFISLGSLLERVPQLAENEIENLIRCGACDGFELTRPELLWRHALTRKERRGQKKLRGGSGNRDTGRVTVQTATLFPVGGTAPGGGSAVSLIPAIPDYSHTEKLQQEMEVLHLTATGHPMAMLRDWLQQRGVIRARDLGGWAGRRVKVAGNLITAKSATVRKTGQAMKFITLEDETDLCEVTLFPEVYARYGARLLSRGPYLVTGIVEDDHGSVTLTAETLEII
jgi:DNA polymerase III alpha subunit